MRNYGSGSRRDSREGKGRYDLISPYATKRLALRLEHGVDIYGERNWEKGQPMDDFFDSAKRHLDNWQMGNRDEDHLAAAMWNIHCMIHFDSVGYPDEAIAETFKGNMEPEDKTILLHRIDEINCSRCGQGSMLVNSDMVCAECIHLDFLESEGDT